MVKLKLSSERDVRVHAISVRSDAIIVRSCASSVVVEKVSPDEAVRDGAAGEFVMEAYLAAPTEEQSTNRSLAASAHRMCVRRGAKEIDRTLLLRLRRAAIDLD